MTMTLSADTNSENTEGKKPDDAASDKVGAGKALEPAARADSGVAPFLTAAKEGLGTAPRPIFSRLLDYSAHAALMIGLLGFAWTIGDHFSTRSKAAATPVAAVAPVAPPVDQTAELRRETQKMAADISALRQSLDSLRGTMRQDSTARLDKTAEQIHALAANLDGVKTGLNATKTETTAALATLATKIDHLPHNEEIAKIQQIVDRLDKMERDSADPQPTASVPAPTKVAPLAVPPVKPQPVKATTTPETDAAKKPTILPDWVVREVYDGIAVIESKHGPMEVGPGDTIPGAGVVKSIDRHGATWVVITSKGQLAYAPPPRDHAPRDYYRAGARDF